MIFTKPRPPKISLPPGPTASRRRLGREIVRRPVAALVGLKRAYGPIYTLNLPGFSEPIVVLGTAELVKPLIEAEGEQVVRADSYSSFLNLLPVPLLIAMRGERHARLRKLMLAMLSTAAEEITSGALEHYLMKS